MKRLLSLLLVACMLVSLVPAMVFAAPEEKLTTTESPVIGSHAVFGDVSENDWFFDAVSYAHTNGFFNGTSETTFSPNGTMTRAMFVTVLGRMAGVDTAGYSGEAPFGDISPDSYYAPYVAWAYKSGVTSGTSEKTFSPDGLINREQMAAFFVRYFEIFGVDYNTGADIATTPADIGNVSSWAQDAVKKLWKQGLLNGDGVNFNPVSNATRAETATLCMRADKAVTTWNSEPVNPPKQDEKPDKEEENKEQEKPEENKTNVNKPSYGGPSSGSSSGGTTTQKTYYEVSFLLGEGVDSEGVTLPETKVYLENTKISLLPTPYKQNSLFLGYYYDSAMENKVGTDDVLTRNTTLYAKMADAESLNQEETPNYITVVLPAEDVSEYSFAINGYEEGCVEYFRHVSNLNADVEFTMDGANVVADLKEGETYSIKLKDSSAAVFYIDGEEKPLSIRVFNIITEKAPVENLSLSSGIKYLSIDSVSDMTGLAFDGLYSVALANDGEISSVTTNKYEGSFTYTGDETISVGDTVAIYAGTRPDERTSATENEKVAYVEILSVNGTTYTYLASDAEDILFMPDVLPVSDTADLVADDGNKLTVAASVFDFSDAKYSVLGLSAETTVEPGDFIAFYSGEFGVGSSGNVIYGKIESITNDGENLLVVYEEVSYDVVKTSMDLYTTRNEVNEISEERIAALENEMLKQAEESGFIEEAARYLTALAIETDGFQELSDDLDMDLSSYSIRFADGTPVDENAMELMSVKAEITESKIEPNIIIGKLTHFEDKRGIRGEIAMTFTVEVGEGDNKLVIELQAIFEQEILMDINVSGGAVWEWAWIIPYIADYQMDANVDLGTYTGIGITATARTQGEDEEEEGFDWKPVTDNKFEEKIINISKQIKDLMEKKDEFMGQFQIPTVGIDGEEIDEDEDRPTIVNGGLAEKYSDMMENAEEAWIEILKIPIMESEGALDYLNILCYGITADFVVSANLYVTIGMTFEHSVAKRYNFSLSLFEKKVTNDTIDLEENHYQFDFYVMGTIGIRAGIELEMCLGLFSTKMDSVGIEAEVGAYAQMWGYFYFSLSWSESEGKKTEYSGAMAIDVGMYMEIKFVAQLFSSDKLTYDPTLYEDEFPFLTIGSVENVYDFAYEEDDEMLDIEVDSVRAIDVPSNLFSMNYMDMKSGEIFGTEGEDEEHLEPISYIDSEKEHFDIEFSNRAFRYDAENNKILVEPFDKFSIDEETTMTITWKKAPLAFTSQSLQRVVNIHWYEVNGVRSYNFLTGNGTVIEPISAMIKAPIEWPEDPVREGYIFKGWKERVIDWKGGEEAVYWPGYYVCPEESKMPDDFRGYTYRILVADWEARNDIEYAVEVYLETADVGETGKTYYSYDLKDTIVYHNGTSDTERILGTTHIIDANRIAGTGYHLNRRELIDEEKKVIAANGSTKYKIYYDLDDTYITFIKGGYNNTPFDDGSSFKENVIAKKYGEYVTAPKLVHPGYVLTGFQDEYGNFVEPETPIMVTGNSRYTGIWEPASDTGYRIYHKIENEAFWGEYTIYEITLKNGTTNTKANISDSDWLMLNGYYADKTHPDNILSANIDAAGNATLVLHYTRNKNTVTYNLGGKEVTSGIDIELLDENNKVTLIQGNKAPNIIPEFPGYVFEGWYTRDGYWIPEYEYNFETPVTSNITLYAYWTKKTYDVTISHYTQNLDGSYKLQDVEPIYKTEMFEIKFATGDIVNVSDFIKKAREYPGFELNTYNYGFGTSPDNKGLIKEYTITADFDKKKENIIFLYDRRSYNFDGFFENGGTVVTEGSKTGSYYFEQELIPPVLKKDGYEFKGWSDTQGGAVVEVPKTIPATGVGGYYAIWEPLKNNSYRLDAYFQDEFGNYNLDDSPESTVFKDGVTGEFKTANDFADLYINRYGGYEIDNSTPNASQKWEIKPDGSCVISLYYKRIERTVTYMVDGKVYHTIKGRWGSEVDSDKLPANPTKIGVTFAYWAEDEAGGGYFGTCKKIPNKDTTVYAIWSVARYSLSWDFAGGYATNLSEYTGAGMYDYGTPIVAPVLKKTGHTFNGWNETVSDKLYDNKTYVASWTPWKTTIKFHPNVPEGMERYLKGTMEDQVVVYGEENILNPNTFELTGTAYVPDYWKIKQGRIDLGAKLPDLQIEENGVIDLYMSWKTVPTSYELHVLVQKVNGSYPWSDNPNFVIKKTGEVGEEITLDNWKEVTEVDTTHFTFDSENERSFGTVGATGNSVFYGYYKRNKYPVTWKDGDGNVVFTEDFFYESTPSYNSEARPTKTTDEKYSYTFNGNWKVDGGDLLDNNYKMSGPVTMIAQFNEAPRTYTATFHGNGGFIGSKETYTTEGAYGSNSIKVPDSHSVYHNEDDQYIYEFSHWAENPDGTGERLTTESYNPTSDKTWYAHWNKTVKVFWVYWHGLNGKFLESYGNVPYGTTPELHVEIPAQAEDDQYIYTFKGWNPEVGPITGDTSYYAIYEAIEKTIDVIYYDYTGTAFKETKELYSIATDPEKHTEAPAEGKPSTDEYDYVFTGYRQDLSEIKNGIVKYYAEYEEKVATYTITWLNYDGTILAVEEYEYGEWPEYKGETPTKEPSDPDYECVFDCWDPEVYEVTEDATYTATFYEAEAIVYIYWRMRTSEYYLTTPEYAPGKIEPNWIVKYRIGDDIVVPDEVEYNIPYNNCGYHKVVVGWTSSPGSSTPDEIGKAERSVMYYPILENSYYLYNVWVSGVRVTSENMDDILGDGTASYDAASNTLTLNNYVFDSDSEYTVIEEDGVKYSAAIVSVNTKINILGETKINASKEAGFNEEVAGIVWRENASMNIGSDEATASADIKGSDYGIRMLYYADLSINLHDYSSLNLSGNERALYRLFSLNRDFSNLSVFEYDTFNPADDADGPKFLEPPYSGFEQTEAKHLEISDSRNTAN